MKNNMFSINAHIVEDDPESSSEFSFTIKNLLNEIDNLIDEIDNLIEMVRKYTVETDFEES